MNRQAAKVAALAGVVLLTLCSSSFAQSALSITTTSLPPATAGTAYSTPVRATGGVPPYFWALGNGGALTISPNGGVISGDPGTAGTLPLRVTVLDSSMPQRRSITVPLPLSVRQHPAIQPASLPQAIIGRAYSVGISVSGGLNPSAPALFAGTLPPGIALANGTISGTPSALGTFPFTVQSRDANGAIASRYYTLVVDHPPLLITTTTLPPGSGVGAGFKATLAASGGLPPYRWSLATGALPTGLKLDVAGSITGTVIVAGNFTFTVAVTDAANTRTVSQPFRVTVNPLLTIATPSPLPSGRLGETYRVAFQAAGGTPPYSWVSTATRAVGLGLPAGLTLSSSGELSGVLTAAGPFSFTLTVTDALGLRVARSYSVNVYQVETVLTTIAPSSVTLNAVEQGPAQLGSVQIATTARNLTSFVPSVAYEGPQGWLKMPGAVLAREGQNGLLTLQATPGSLARGTYSARVSVEGPGVSGDAVRVTMTVGPAQRIILPSPLGATFLAIEGGPSPAPQQVAVVNGGTGLLTWNVSATTLEGGEWLQVAPVGGTSEAGGQTGVFTIRVSPAGLARGDYYGLVTVASTGAVNSPQAVTVVLSVRPTGSASTISLQPAGLVLRDSEASPLVLVNPGRDPVEYFTSAEPGDSGIAASPPAGTLPPGVPVTLQIRSSAPAGGFRRSALNFVLSNGERKTLDVVAIGSSTGVVPGQLAGGDSVSAAAVICSPTQLVPLSTLLGTGFNIPAGWPTPVEVLVVDDCGQALNKGSVSVSFSNGDTSLNLVPVGGGRWSGTWVGRNALTPEVTVTVMAEDAAASLRGMFQTTGGVEVNSEPPVIDAGSIVNAASFARSAPLAPGAFVSIFGSKFATATAIDVDLPLSPSLGVTTVTLGGRVLPLQYASDGQINAVLPYEIGLDSPQSLLIRRGSTLSVPEQVIATSSQPGIFTRDQSGRGQGIIVDANYKYVDSLNPARAGDSVTIFATGLGRVTPAVEAGSAAPSAPLSRTDATVSVTVGGIPAIVSFAGLAPGFAGLYQVNIAIPAGVTDHDATAVVVAAGGRASVPVTIATRAAR